MRTNKIVYPGLPPRRWTRQRRGPSLSVDNATCVISRASLTSRLVTSLGRMGRAGCAESMTAIERPLGSATNLPSTETAMRQTSIGESIALPTVAAACQSWHPTADTPKIILGGVTVPSFFSDDELLPVRCVRYASWRLKCLGKAPQFHSCFAIPKANFAIVTRRGEFFAVRKNPRTARIDRALGVKCQNVHTPSGSLSPY